MSEQKPTTGQDIPTDQFDMLVGGWLRASGAPDPDELASLETFVRALPERRPASRFRTPAVPRPALVLGALALALAVAATGGLTLYGTLHNSASQSFSATSSPFSTPTIAPTPQRIVTPLPIVAPPDPAPFVNDPGYKACQDPSLDGLAVGSFPVIAAVELGYAQEYHQRLPDLGFVPALEVPYPALVVVYAGRSPTYGATPDNPTSHQPDLGLHDVCVAIDDGGSPQLFHNVSVYWGYLDGSVNPPPSSQPVPRLLNLSCTSDMAWDAVGRALWCADVVRWPRELATLLRYDPSTGGIDEWSIPSDFGPLSQTQFGFHVRVDSTGIVWISEPTRVVRFDPSTGKSKSLLLSGLVEDGQPSSGLTSSSPGAVPIETSVPTSESPDVAFDAIATDGDSALVARLNTDYLTRIAADLTVTEIPIPSELVATAPDQQGFAVDGGRIFLTRPSDRRIWILSPNGSLVAVSNVASAAGHARLDVRPNGSSSEVVVWTDNLTATAIDDAGVPVEQFAVQVELPRAEDGNQPQYEIATDWAGRFWYSAGTSSYFVNAGQVVEVDPAP
jgi:hypothetical protein